MHHGFCWTARFGALGFQDNVTAWESLADELRTNLLVDPGIARFARLHQVWACAGAGPAPVFLDRMLDALAPADRALPRAQPGFPPAAPATPLPYFADSAGAAGPPPVRRPGGRSVRAAPPRGR
ncbi:hypothetical protein AB0D30_31385 [Streptomyces sp. NPDC048409]|uniref:hypothetical protein n=1 Tax=Streptomyces sp. NPDC048409 TaxID=3154723 RepID=UPI00344AE8EC